MKMRFLKDGSIYTILHELELEAKDKIKYRRIVVIAGKMEYHYICNSVVWNYWLGRYYPKAELMFTVEHLK